MEDFGIILTPPKNQNTVEWVTPDADIYDAYVSNVEPVENPYYNRDPENPGTPFKLEWTFQIDENALGELSQDDLPDGIEERRWGKGLRFFKTTTKLGSHPKNGLVKALRAIDPDFDIEVGYESFEAMKAKVIGNYVRVITEDSFSKDKTKRYLKVTGLLPSKKGKVDTATLLALQTGGKTSILDEDPFA